MAHRLHPEDLEDRIDCFGEFDRSDSVCLAHCSLNIECAAARERYQNLQMLDDSLEALVCSHNA